MAAPGVSRLDLPHDNDCPARGVGDPDDCRCDLPGDTRSVRPATAPRTERAATPDQTRRLNILFGKAGIRDRTARLARASASTGRPVTSTSRLTERENRALCDALLRTPREEG